MTGPSGPSGSLAHGARRGARSNWSHDLATALRGVAGSPLYSVPAILSIALGIGATTAIFVLFNAVVLRPLPFAREEELAVIFDDVSVPGLDKMPISAPELDDYAKITQSFASIAAYDQTEGTVTGIGEPRHVVTVHCTLNFFDTLKGGPALGRGFTASGPSRDDLNVAVISHRFWISVLGGAPALGQTLVVDGVVRTIVGVLSTEQALPATADVWTPLKLTEEQATQAGYRFLFAIARLSPGVSLESAQHELAAVSQARREAARGASRRVKAFLVPLREELLGSSRTSVQAIFAAVALFFLLACTNVVSLLLTRASVQRREFALRAALGASPRRLRRQTILEALLLTLVGGVAGLGLASAMVWGAARSYGDLLAHAHPSLDGRVVGFFALLCAVTALAVGASPALHASRVKPIETLRAGGRASEAKGSRRVREALVSAQVAATVALLAGAGILTRSVLALTSVEPGFDPAGVVTARVSLPRAKYDDPQRTAEFFRRAVEELQSLPGVAAAAAASLLPLSDVYEVTLQFDASAVLTERVHAEERHVTVDYFRALGIPLREGRGFISQDRPGAEPIAVVNRAFARTFFGDAPVIGKRFDVGGRNGAKWLSIVGVVEDSRDFGFDSGPRPTFFVPMVQAPVHDASFAVRSSGDAGALLRQLTDKISGIDPELPVYAPTTLRRTVEASYASRTVLAWLLLSFAGAAMILAAVGLFGVTSYSVSQRVREIAIRRAIGATAGAILRMVLYETAVVVGIGVAVGLLGAWYAARFMASLIFGVTGSDPVTYALVCAAVSGVALLSALPPARSASKVAPLASLKSG